MAAARSGNSSVATAMAIAGRAASACDVCGRQRARWYCAADEAYLCQRCDGNVHGANALALRHERVRLGPNGVPMKMPNRSTSDLSSHLSTRSMKGDRVPDIGENPNQTQSPNNILPSRKRSRTSRPHPHLRGSNSHLRCAGGGSRPPHKIHRSNELHAKVKVEPQQKEGKNDEGAHEVPAFITVSQDSQDPNVSAGHGAGFYEEHSTSEHSFSEYFKSKAAAAPDDISDDSDQFLVPDHYLDSGVDFCGEIEGTLGSLMGEAGNFTGTEIPGVDGFGEVGYCGSKDLTAEDYGLTFSDMVAERGGTSDAFEGDGSEAGDRGRVESEGTFPRFFPGRVKTETSLWSAEKIKKEAQDMLRCSLKGLSQEDLRQVPSLRLNYEDVLSAWSDRSLWTDGKRPQTVPDDSNSDTVGGCMDIGLVPDIYSGNLGCNEGGQLSVTTTGDEGFNPGGGREARVLRYKEKRRTRLFSKKIRYEVRKLNAERRPRMKGRFVKRTAAAS